MGPISYREAMHYADELDLNSDNREFLWDVIRRTDAAFLNMMNDKTQQEAEAAKAKREPHGRGTSRY